jgi:hypothetical protein
MSFIAKVQSTEHDVNVLVTNQNGSVKKYVIKDSIINDRLKFGRVYFCKATMKNGSIIMGDVVKKKPW